MECLPPGALFLPLTGTLVIADMHLGKAAHFRKNGIPLHKMVNQGNLWKLSALIAATNPSQMVFLGDLFHSAHNHEWEEWVDFLDNYSSIQRILVHGNHDILDHELYSVANFLSCDVFSIESLLFTHDVLPEIPAGFLNVSGHVHPAVRLQSSVHKSLRLPCFYHHGQHLLLPAFGEFTGMKSISPARNATVLGLVENSIVDLSCAENP